MNGPFSTTTQYSFDVPSARFPVRLDTATYSAADVTGDGFFDLPFFYASGTGAADRVKVIDPVRGAVLLALEDPTYAYDTWLPSSSGYRCFADLDGDGKLEFVVRRHSKRSRANDFLVYSRNAPTTAVSNDASDPTDFALSQNYPNPFNLTTTVEYSLEKRGMRCLPSTMCSRERFAGTMRVCWSLEIIDWPGMQEMSQEAAINTVEKRVSERD